MKQASKCKAECQINESKICKLILKWTRKENFRKSKNFQPFRIVIHNLCAFLSDSRSFVSLLPLSFLVILCCELWPLFKEMESFQNWNGIISKLKWWKLITHKSNSHNLSDLLFWNVQTRNTTAQWYNKKYQFRL